VPPHRKRACHRPQPRTTSKWLGCKHWPIGLERWPIGLKRFVDHCLLNGRSNGRARTRRRRRLPMRWSVTSHPASHLTPHASRLTPHTSHLTNTVAFTLPFLAFLMAALPPDCMCASVHVQVSRCVSFGVCVCVSRSGRRCVEISMGSRFGRVWVYRCGRGWAEMRAGVAPKATEFEHLKPVSVQSFAYVLHRLDHAGQALHHLRLGRDCACDSADHYREPSARE
jgi:hypothetical protein